MAKAKYEHVNAAKRYARAVIGGKKVAGKFERFACRRFLDDLHRHDVVFDPAKANRACRFIERLPHIKGEWSRAKELIRLEPWQSFAIVNVFGFQRWDQRRGKYVRRFRQMYLCVARKNAKSTLAAAIGLYCLVEDDEYGAEIYSGATSEAQAWEVFKPAKMMALRHPKFTEHYGVQVHAKSLSQPDRGGSFKPIIGKPGDGASPSCALIDEFHEHTSWDLYNAMNTGMGAREQPLMVIITTAGDDMASPCFEKDSDARLLLEGTFKDDAIFTVIYTADDDDDWQSVTAQKKANPNYGVSVDPQYLKSMLAEARRSPKLQASYKTKHLNKWVNAGAAFLNSLDWQRCADASLRLEDYVGKPCIFGLDLATRIDFVALLRVFFERRPDGNLEYTWFPRFWIPNNRVLEDTTGQYLRWKELGALEVHPDDEIDFALLRAALIEENLRFNPYEAAFDPWRAAGIEQELSAEGLTMVKIPQTIASYTDPMNELEAACKGNPVRLHHPDNPVLNWMSGNLTAREHGNNKKPDRIHPKRKIDGMTAGVMGINRAMISTHGGLSDWLKSIGKTQP